MTLKYRSLMKEGSWVEYLGSTGLTPGDPGVYWWNEAGDVDHYYH